MGQDYGLVFKFSELELHPYLIGCQLLIELEAHHLYSSRSPKPGGLGCGEKKLAGFLWGKLWLFRQRGTPRARLRAYTSIVTT